MNTPNNNSQPTHPVVAETERRALIADTRGLAQTEIGAGCFLIGCTAGLIQLTVQTINANPAQKYGDIFRQSFNSYIGGATALSLTIGALAMLGGGVNRRTARTLRSTIPATPLTPPTPQV